MTAPFIFNMNNDQIVRFASAAGAIEPINSVSSRYSFVSTLDAVDLLRETGWFPIKVGQSGTRSSLKEGFQKHYIRFARNEHLDAKDERVDLILYNSHDLGSSFKLIASIWRQVCGNGLMVASELANYTHRHVGFNPDDFMESAVKIADSTSVIADQVSALKEIHLLEEERQIFAEAAHRLVYDAPETAPIKPEKLLGSRRFADDNSDLFTTYNVVQENIIKGGLHGAVYNPETRKTRKITTRPVRSLDRDIKLNQALWVLTEKMAEFKQKMSSPEALTA
jgi:hypothetical protein